MVKGVRLSLRTAWARCPHLLRLAVVPLLIVLATWCEPDRQTAAISAGMMGAVAYAAALHRCLRIVRRPWPRGRVRGAWWAVAVSCGTEFLVTFAFAAADSVPDRQHTLIMLGYGARALSVTALVVAVLAFPQRARSGRELAMLVLDTLMVTGSSLLLGWYFVIGPLVARDSVDSSAAAGIAVAVADFALICVAAFVLLRGVGAEIRTAVRYLIVSTVCLGIPDLVMVARAARGQQEVDLDGLLVDLVAIGAYLTAAAAWSQPLTRHHPAPDDDPDGPAAAAPGALPGLIDSLIPYLAVVVGYGLLLTAAARSGLYPWGGLMAGTIVMTGAVVTRQILALEENRRLAVTDHVTGLSNRAGLLHDVERILARTRRGGVPAALMFFDLDGFKAVNDRLGHDAGDRALVAFARVLRQNVLGSDLVARMGGDEFAVILTRVHGPQDAVVVAERILDALRTPLLPGDVPVRIGTSIGISLTTSEAGDGVEELLRRADRAMYEAKRDAGSCWRVHVVEPPPPPVPSPADAPWQPGAEPDR